MMTGKINNVSNPYINNQHLPARQNISFKAEQPADSFESGKQPEFEAAKRTADKILKFFGLLPSRKKELPEHIEFKKSRNA